MLKKGNKTRSATDLNLNNNPTNSQRVLFLALLIIEL